MYHKALYFSTLQFALQFAGSFGIILIWVIMRLREKMMGFWIALSVIVVLLLTVGPEESQETDGLACYSCAEQFHLHPGASRHA